jgi:CheY-like chemotaxis protein
MSTAPRSPSAAASTPATAPASETSAPTILVIEDYSDTRELLSALLHSNGYNVVEAEDGIEGILKAGWLYPDLILMDLSLPEMDGVEAAARIHAQAKLSRIPIFVVSACVEVFSKPFDPDVLLERIRATLK